jgi:hypothetical protein
VHGKFKMRKPFNIHQRLTGSPVSLFSLLVSKSIPSTLGASSIK